MTGTLRDLLHESVADVESADLTDRAWRDGVRARRRRTTSVVAGAAAASLVVAGSVWALDHRSDSPSVGPVHRPSPTATPFQDKGSRPDGDYRGTSVWWAPSVARESSLAYAASPLPTTIDLSQVGREISATMPPVGTGMAAFALVGDGPGRVLSVGVLGADGVLRLVDTSRVQPMRDPEGNLRVRVGSSMLSPSGEYLMFPQQRSVLLLRLRDGEWSTIQTGARDTWDATWTSDNAFMLKDPERPQALGPTYAISGKRVGATRDWSSVFPSTAYGPARRSPRGSLAQSYIAGADVPQPPALHLSPRQSDWIGVASAPDAILVLPQEAARQKQCCQVAGWLDSDVLLYESRSSDGLRLLAWQQGTGNFWQVSQVVGWTLGQESVISSYARFPVAQGAD